MTSSTNTLESNESSTLARSMSLVYLWLSYGLFVSTLFSILLWKSPLSLTVILGNNFIFYGLGGVEFVIGLIFIFFHKQIGYFLSLMLFTFYSIMTGLLFSVSFLVFELDSIITLFLGTTGAFLALSFYGYFTKRDLGPIGILALFGFVGIVIVETIYFFSSKFSFISNNNIIPIVGIFFIATLISYDTQEIRKAFSNKQPSNTEILNAAFSLYLDFVILFLRCLDFLGRKK